MLFKIGVLKSFLTCKGKHQCWNLFSINLQTCSFFIKRLQHRCFSINITKFLKLLGVTIEKHISNIYGKAKAKVGALSRSSFYEFQLEKMLMNAFFRAQFNYCPLVWCYIVVNLITR